MKLLFLKSFCLVMLAVTVSNLGATTLKRLTHEELATQAELIVVGRHVESRSVWVGRMLMTRVTVAVGETLKGQAQPTVTVDIPGGIDMNRKIPIGMSVAGAPTIHAGEQVVLFLSRSEGLRTQAGIGAYGIVGFSQGKFTVVEEQDGSRVVPMGRAVKMTLDKFKAQIRSHVSGQGGRRAAPTPPGGTEE